MIFALYFTITSCIVILHLQTKRRNDFDLIYSEAVTINATCFMKKMVLIPYWYDLLAFYVATGQTIAAYGMSVIAFFGWFISSFVLYAVLYPVLIDRENPSAFRSLGIYFIVESVILMVVIMFVGLVSCFYTQHKIYHVRNHLRPKFKTDDDLFEYMRQEGFDLDSEYNSIGQDADTMSPKVNKKMDEIREKNQRLKESNKIYTDNVSLVVKNPLNRGIESLKFDV